MERKQDKTGVVPPPSLSAEKVAHIEKLTPGTQWRSRELLLNRQIEACRLREAGKKGYNHQGTALLIQAASAVPDLEAKLGIVGYRHNYQDAGSRVTLLVVLSDGRLAVLKVGPRSGEAEQLKLLAERGASVPEILNNGVIGRGGKMVAWLLMRFIEGHVLGAKRPFLVVEPGLDYADVRRRVAEAGNFFRLAHQPLPAPYDGPHDFPGAISFREEVGQYFDSVCVPKAAEAGLMGPGDPTVNSRRWLCDFDTAALAAPPALLHGDPAEVNVMERPDGKLVFIDPVTSYGPPEFDAARWISRLFRHGGHSPYVVADLAGVAVNVEPKLDLHVLLLALACELRADAWHESVKQGREYALQLVRVADELVRLSPEVAALTPQPDYVEKGLALVEARLLQLETEQKLRVRGVTLSEAISSS